MITTTLQDRFRQHLQAALESNKLSQSELARAMGVTPQYVSAYLCGTVSPGLAVIERFAKSLGVSDPAAMLQNELKQSQKTSRKLQEIA